MPRPSSLPANVEGEEAVGLLDHALRAGAGGLIFVARSETRAARLHDLIQALAPAALRVLLLPGWDCLPYDRVSPSRAVMGHRLATVRALQEAAGARLLILSAEAAAQRIPPAVEAGLRLQVGEPVEPAALRADLVRLGYDLDAYADEAGEAVIHGSVADIVPPYPPEAPAWRLRLEEGRIAAIDRFDRLTQRSQDAPAEEMVIGPASELVLPPGDAEEATDRAPGLEHALAEHVPGLVAPLALLPRAAVVLDEGAAEAVARRREEVEEAFRIRLAVPGEGGRIPPPSALYLDEVAWLAALDSRTPGALAPAEPVALPERTALGDAADLHNRLQSLLAQGLRVAVAVRPGGAARRLRARVPDLADTPRVADWPALRALPPGSLALFETAADLPVIAAGDAVLIPNAPAVAAHAAGAGRGGMPMLDGIGALQPGDAVIHFDHGLASLEGLEPVGEAEERQDCLRLRFADGIRLVPFGELDRIWRYGAAARGLKLDRIGAEAWARRRAKAEQHVREVATGLAAEIARREEATAPALHPTARLAEVSARFTFQLTPDQRRAIAATLADLASGRPMDRLVCGDVGYGKTEVAIRAAAVAALAGGQVALLAPTTVLVRQHLATLTARFAGLPIRVAALSRLIPAAEARALRTAIAAGEVDIAIGTQALLGRAVRFRDLALLVVDEEQRFGARQKEALRRAGNGRLHRLALSATPIPRTLQAALIGLRDLSVIATPPALRQPVRTLAAPLDAALLAQVLRREARRGGQSFVVCPRIEDIAPMQARLQAAVPGLSVLVAHGALPPAALDDAMMRFAEGRADILLCTNVVEAGLDVPRANTMLVWQPEHFGLAQLHQLRGRVGRGRARGVFYLLSDSAAPPAAAAAARLDTLQSLDRVGAGFAISARDLDQRGAGEMLGETQSGHLRLVGIELYAHLLNQALARARGTVPATHQAPEMVIAVEAHVPAAYMPEEAMRIGLHLRLGDLMREGDPRGVADLRDELEDRFGEVPPALGTLLAVTRLAITCRRLGVAALEVGPLAAAARPEAPARSAPPGLELRQGRLVLPRPSAAPQDRLGAADALLAAIAAQRP